MPLPRSAILLLSLLATVSWLPSKSTLSQDDPFANGVRTTPWLSPADEQKAFQLPPGFEINLVAAEPDIQKPLNMAFDERGRIWLTNTIEYPYAAPPDRPAQDTIKILEDTDGDGRYEKVTTFADGLNIPMGIYPWKGGCVAFSIPNIWHFEDTDGDGVCDKRTVLYGPFDTTRDTHGMINALRRGWDGWVYACHGFNNDSRVKGTDGHEIHMQSGNVFRFKLDGSRIEHFTHGQVNPFGMCFDEYFNIFTADCHSKPVYQLLRGGYYPSFGKPHDGLGFVPPMMDHLHGSTAICGLVKYSGENFPEEFRGDFYSGNVMTSRINRNKPEYHGSTIKAIEQPDFLSTTDPWFRPVDIQIGPDGAMYILDFYNRIIGHYEVPLPHPGRDRTSGRIWRVVYKEKVQDRTATKLPADLTKLTLDELVAQFGNSQLEYRVRALNYFCDRANVVKLNRPFGLSQDEYLKLLYRELAPQLIPAATWARRRTYLETHDPDLGDNNPVAAVHDIKASFHEGVGPFFEWGAKLESKNQFIARAAVEGIGHWAGGQGIVQLLKALSATPEDDALLRHQLKMTIRDSLADLWPDQQSQILRVDDDLMRLLMPIAAATPSDFAASLVIKQIEVADLPPETLLAYFQHSARHADDQKIKSLVGICRTRFAGNAQLQGQLVSSLSAAIEARGGIFADVSEDFEKWAEEVTRELLQPKQLIQIPWSALSISGEPTQDHPWVITPRASRDGDKTSLFFSSLPRGEQRTGIYRSAAFEIPEQLSFWCAGHSGRPPAPLNDHNRIRLKDARTHEILAESRPPRNDTARQITWDLRKYIKREGETAAELRRGFIELIDGDTANAYAWLAVGRFSLAELNPSDAPPRQQIAAEIISKLKLVQFKPQAIEFLIEPKTDAAARAVFARALLVIDPPWRPAVATALANVIADPLLPDSLRPKIGEAIVKNQHELLFDALREVMKRAPMRLQTSIADTLAGDVDGASSLLALIEDGQVSPRVLLAPNVGNKLATLKNDRIKSEVSAVIEKLPPADAILDALITDRRRAFAQAKTNIERGQTVFAKHCAACHKIADKGNLIGPQLDGIGNRGLDRLLEDILDPNRNVDVAFRTTTLRLTDGRVLSGLHRREEGTQLLLADNQGKEFSINKSEIDEQQKTPLSLMPANVPEIVPADEFADLMAYLLGKRSQGKN